MSSEDEAVLGIDIIDISMFRLRLSANLRSNLMSDLHQVCPTDGLGLDAAEWSTIPEATESHVTLDAGLIQQRIFCGKFEERNPFNIPGPFYGGQTDTCETGPLEAPQNVMLDGEGQEFVFRQPTTAESMDGKRPRNGDAEAEGDQRPSGRDLGAPGPISGQFRRRRSSQSSPILQGRASGAAVNPTESQRRKVPSRTPPP